MPFEVNYTVHGLLVQCSQFTYDIFDLKPINNYLYNIQSSTLSP